MSSMSCSPLQDADLHRRRMPAPALELLDEGWFFSNTLANKNNKPPLPRRSSGSDKDREQGDNNKLKASASAGPSRLFHRRLLRTPSLPSPRVGMPTMEIMPKQDDDLVLVVEQEEDATGSGSGNQQQQQQLQVEAEVDDDDLNWSSIYEGVLRSRMAERGGGGGGRGPAPLRRAPSMPVPSSATDYRHTKPTPRTPSSSGEQQRRRAQVRSSSASHHQQPPVLARSKSVFQDKKWRSSGDLESIEVPPSPRLIKQAAGSRSSRPHVPEAWQQRPAALVRVQSSSDHARSTAAAEMKDQLRLWAQAVACNVRQEC